MDIITELSHPPTTPSLASEHEKGRVQLWLLEFHSWDQLPMEGCVSTSLTPRILSLLPR